MNGLLQLQVYCVFLEFCILCEIHPIFIYLSHKTLTKPSTKLLFPTLQLLLISPVCSRNNAPALYTNKNTTYIFHIIGDVENSILVYNPYPVSVLAIVLLNLFECVKNRCTHDVEITTDGRPCTYNKYE